MTKRLPDGPQTTTGMRIPDYLEYGNAMMLAARIRTYWAARDKFPLVGVEAIPFNNGHDNRPLYHVRSNMVGGQPI